MVLLSVLTALLFSCGADDKEARRKHLIEQSSLHALHLQTHFITLYEKHLPATVSIARYNPKDQHPAIEGSGFFINEAGFVLTCAHVLPDTRKVLVIRSGKVIEKWPATVFNIDKEKDLALLKVDFGKNIPDKLPHIQVEMQNNMNPGALFMAIGSPYGLNETMIPGFIAHTMRFGADKSRPRLAHVQLSASVFPGSSGGPALDMSGKLIGMMRFTMSPLGHGTPGPGFAIPTSTLYAFVSNQKDIIKHSLMLQRGIVVIPLITLYLIKEVKLPHPRGVLISTVTENTPAQRAGLKRYDFITHVEGETVANSIELTRLLTKYKEKKDLALTIIRDAKEMHVTIRGLYDPDEKQDEKK